MNKIEQGIALHGPMGPTGMGYGLTSLGQAVQKLGRPCTMSGQRDCWASPYYHIVIEQPAFIQPCPWTGLVPTFELPLRDDEKRKLVLPSPRHRMFCLNEFIRDEVCAINKDMPDSCFPLIQQGATSEIFLDVERKLRTIAMVGKYEPRKGPDQFFSVASKVAHAGAYAMAVSPLHNSAEIAETQTLCDKAGVELLPWEPAYESVMAFLASVHVVVAPSCAEGWNLVVSEAVAQNCIVVASDIHAHRRQYEILKAGLGEEEASYRLRLVPTESASIVGHDRWYPGVYYVGKKWARCNDRALEETVEKALRSSPPPALAPKDFPLSWENAAKVLIDRVDEATNQNAKKQSC